MGIISINVVDEGRDQKAVFTCEGQLLVTNMRYFHVYLGPLPPGQDTEISVHCEISVFDWLLKFIKAEVVADRPPLHVDNCLQVLLFFAQYLTYSYLVITCHLVL